MAAPAELEDAVSVALIGRDDEARGQLREALAALGADIVAEKEPANIDGAALLEIGPSVVIVNLDEAFEDELDHLQALFDHPEVNVVFNEAETTRQLSGWDLARWARHLAVKVLGHGDPTPPAPAGREPLPGLSLVPRPGAPPTPAQLAGERFIEEFTMEAEDHADLVPTDYLPMSDPDLPAGAPEAREFDLDDTAIESALANAREQRPEVSAASVPDASIADEDSALPEVDLSMLDAALGTGEPSAQASVETGPEPTGSPEPGPVSNEESADPSARSDDSAVLDAALAEFNLDDDDDAAPRSFSGFSSDDEVADLGADDDVAALAAQLDAMGGDDAPAAEAHPDLDSLLAAQASRDSGPAAALDEDLDVGLASPVGDAATPAEPPAEAPAESGSGIDFGSLELAPMDDSEGVATAKPSESGSGFDFGDLGLSLEPMDGEEAVAAAPTASETSSAIQRVIVLGASIGGPDALRSFLGGIPEGFPALFLLAQHLESGFFERLAQQLQKASKLPVKVAEPGTTASMGEVLVVPSEHRLSLDEEGAISIVDRNEPPRYKPCIDEVMRDVADRFGARATAVIFSGMAGDAVEGAVYLTSKGGEVWAQDAESCVVSSMVDGARARGVVEFTGSPRELAERLVARFGS